ncbi:helix-turn-helix domain-containing protein [Paractinoplanes abujensis]|uniref:DNA-binding NarL/FixJ family response regulator n=1 Tax=Paractinoplanes abujensis TaxID=882441 RepID=A0A7W7CNN6_9ACTN|nr:helix-turn-helix transcriptional regulator [Actinoplanes abujensis]MBB4691639.1 DNA-binding NarL/FixJ family response regulator [Actinoplanes abujensis]
MPASGTSDRPRLTPREHAILELLAQGFTARAMARRLGVAPATVSKHLQNVYRKLGTSDRLVTVLTAQRLRILP